MKCSRTCAVKASGMVATLAFLRTYTSASPRSLDKEAASKKADIIARCNDKAGGIDEVEWTYIGPDGRVNGIISGPKGRFSIKSIYAGGYNIQCLHVRVLVHKLK